VVRQGDDVNTIRSVAKENLEREQWEPSKLLKKLVMTAKSPFTRAREAGS
jgi:hypothetical protein